MIGRIAADVFDFQVKRTAVFQRSVLIELKGNIGIRYHADYLQSTTRCYAQTSKGAWKTTDYIALTINAARKRAALAKPLFEMLFPEYFG